MDKVDTKLFILRQLIKTVSLRTTWKPYINYTLRGSIGYQLKFHMLYLCSISLQWLDPGSLAESQL